MISYIRGELDSVEEGKAIIDVSGVGYGIFMPGQALSILPEPGNEVKIYTYLNVREDALQLYGFLSRDDLEIFKLVIGVSGIGPKGGLNILSRMSPDELRFAIISGDVKTISSAPGIGKKTAEKLIVELKDKITVDNILENRGGSGSYDLSSPPDAGMHAEAIQALTALGYGSQESLRAVRKTSTECTTVEEILKEALKYLI